MFIGTHFWEIEFEILELIVIWIKLSSLFIYVLTQQLKGQL
jgi:hypothetical protein